MAKRSRKRYAMTKSETFIFQRENNISNNENMFYAFLDNYDFVDDDGNYRSQSEDSDKTLAKIINRDNLSQKFLIKVDYTYKPYNPISVYGNKKAYKGLDQTRPMAKFVNVNKKAFETYINFLKTKNISWLHNTEREMQ
jgi:hypothetical protein